VADNTVLSSIV